MTVVPFAKTRNLQRIRHIVNVMVKHGFGHIVDRLNLHAGIPLGRRITSIRRLPARTVARHTASERVRMVLEELGPTFIKLGQVLSSRPDLVPQQLAAELRKLQDAVPPFPFSQVETILKEEMGKPLRELFPEFDTAPCAAASIAQVHRAVLASGEKVVVKVQRPGVARLLETDIQILRELAPLLERVMPRLRPYNPVGIVEEFARSVQRELDFAIEARNTELVRRNFEDDREVVVPRVFWDLTSRRVLVLERLDGVKIDDLESIERHGWDRHKLAQTGTHAFMKQVFEHGLFHADPHPGNMLVLEDGRLALVDFGIVGRLDRKLAKRVGAIFLALLERDVERLADECAELGIGGEKVESPEFRRDMSELLDRYYGLPLKYIRPENFFHDFLRAAGRYQIVVPADFVLLAKMMVVVGGIGRALDPDFNIVEVAGPFAREIIRTELGVKRFTVGLVRSLTDLSSLLDHLPRELASILGKLKRGQLKFEFEHRGLEDSIRELDRVGNRMSFSIVVAAIVIASSLMVVSGRGRMVFGLPVLGLLGYLTAAILGLWLLIGILRSGRI